MITWTKKWIHSFFNLLPWKSNGLQVPFFLRGTYRGKYEPETYDFMKENIKPGDVFVDVGANIGYFSRLALAQGATVYTFEPDPRNLRFLRRNAGEAEIFECALGDKKHDSTLNLDYDVTRSSLSFFRDETVKKIPIKVEKLDEIVSAANVVKIDVEGDEVLVLAGAIDLLRRKKPLLIVENNAPGDLKEFLQTNGYVLSRICDGKNAVYLPRVC